MDSGLTRLISRVWISSANVQAVAAKGYKLIHAASDYFYLVRHVPALLTVYSNVRSDVLRTAEEADGSEVIPQGS